MKESKALFWLVLWGACFVGVFWLCFPYFAMTVDRCLSGVPLLLSPAELVFFLFYVPFVLVPLLIVSLCRAIKEGNKTIKIVSICLLVVHVAFIATGIIAI